jgi:hypothetical protein
VAYFDEGILQETREEEITLKSKANCLHEYNNINQSFFKTWASLFAKGCQALPTVLQINDILSHSI